MIAAQPTSGYSACYAPNEILDGDYLGGLWLEEDAENSVESLYMSQKKKKKKDASAGEP